MKNKKIIEAFDLLNPDEEKGMQMLGSIREKKNKTENRGFSFNFTRLAYGCAVVLLAVMIVPGIFNRNVPVESDGTPFAEVESAESFRQLGIYADVPDGSMEVGYYIVMDEYVQISFTYENVSYNLTAKKDSLNIHDFYTQAIEKEGSGSVSLYEDGTGLLAVWNIDNTYYCLYGYEMSDQSLLLETVSRIKY